MSDRPALTTTEAYDLWARSYDAHDNPLVAQSELPLAELTPVLSGKRVLELGCGTGRLAPAILAAGATEYVGVDGSSGMLERARTLQDPRAVGGGEGAWPRWPARGAGAARRARAARDRRALRAPGTDHPLGQLPSRGQRAANRVYPGRPDPHTHHRLVPRRTRRHPLPQARSLPRHPGPPRTARLSLMNGGPARATGGGVHRPVGAARKSGSRSRSSS